MSNLYVQIDGRTFFLLLGLQGRATKAWGLDRLHYSGGESIFLWESYFPFARLFFVEIVDKTHFSQSRVKVFAGSQDDVNILQRVVDAAGKFNVIIDDGSHVNRHQIESFEILFPSLKGGRDLCDRGYSNVLLAKFWWREH